MTDVSLRARDVSSIALKIGAQYKKISLKIFCCLYDFFPLTNKRNVFQRNERLIRLSHMAAETMSQSLPETSYHSCT